MKSCILLANALRIVSQLFRSSSFNERYQSLMSCQVIYRMPLHNIYISQLKFKSFSEQQSNYDIKQLQKSINSCDILYFLFHSIDNMWYKYLNRATDDLRLFRRANIKFNQDDFGMLKFKFVSKSNDYLFRLLRTEGTLRGAGSFALAAAFSILFYLKSHYYDPVYTAPKLIEQKRKDEEMDRKARETLFHNNLGVPTRPTRKIEDFMTFITSSEALNKNFEYMMFGLDLNSDQMAGLDSYSTENDERMLEMLAESKRRQGGH